MTSGSSQSSNKTWQEFRYFSYDVKASHVHQGIVDGLRRFPDNLPSNMSSKPADYCISGFNIELEATPGAAAALKMANLTIAAISPGNE